MIISEMGIIELDALHRQVSLKLDWAYQQAAHYRSQKYAYRTGGNSLSYYTEEQCKEFEDEGVKMTTILEAINLRISHIINQVNL